MIHVYQNFLSEQLLQDIRAYLDQKIVSESPVWYSNVSWNNSVVKNSGNIMITQMAEFKNQLLPYYRGLGDKFQNCDIWPQLFVWSRGAYLPWHDDHGRDFASTIYLNKQWDPDDGGIFLYKDTADAIRGELPEYNKMVINDSKLEHHVTMIANMAKTHRISIQIWGKYQA